MILSTLFRHINSAYRGTDDDAPILGSVDGIDWLDVTNRKISEYARDGKALRSTLFQTVSIAQVVTAGDQTYTMGTSFLLPASSVKVLKTDGTYADYTICEPQERGQYRGAVYFTGSDQQTLTFTDPLLAGDSIIGGTIQVDGYFLPAELTLLTDTIPVDDPYWLVYATASELAGNDLTYESKAADLQAKANNLYSMMSANNRRGTHNNPRTVRTKVDLIRSAETERNRNS